MDGSNPNGNMITRESMGDRFEPIGKAPTPHRQIQRMVDHKAETFCAVRRLPRDADRAKIGELLQLRHESLLPLREAGEDADGLYLSGEWNDAPLDDRLGQGPFTESDLIEITRQVAEGLRYLHQRGIAPVGPSPEHLIELPNGSVKITALALPCAPSETAGIDDPVAHDLRQLGITLRQLATGKRDPSDADVQRVPGVIRSLIKRCLSTEGDRFVTADQLALGLLKSDPVDDELTSPPDSREGWETVPPPGDLGEQTAVTDAGSLSTLSPEVLRKASQPSEPNPAGPSRPTPASASQSHLDAFPWRSANELYKLVGDAKEGGMGSVRMAVEKSTGRKVAIKRILVEAGARRGALERFYREAQSIANLNHPHILQLLQPARDEEGDYLVLEWATGGSLKDVLEKSGKLPIGQVVEVARKIGSALAYAHSKGVIHRDIKPHNILLTETGEPKLADFGLARSVSDLTLSSSRGGAGSPLYMAPEQHTASREADARSDLYSFGKTLYQLTTGKPPVNPDRKLLPPEVRVAIMRCLEEDPALRPNSAKEFIADLDRRPGVVTPLRLGVTIAAVIGMLIVGAFGTGKISFPKKNDTNQIKSLLGNDVAHATTPTDTDANPITPTTTRPAVAPRPTLLGLFAPTGLLVQQETVYDKLLLKVKLEGDLAVDLDSVIVTHNGSRLDATKPRLDGNTVVIEVPMADDQNRFEVEIPGYSSVSSNSINRVYPIPSIDHVDGPVKIDDQFVTQQTAISLRGIVTHAVGVDELWIGVGDDKRPVQIGKDDSFEAQIELNGEGEHLVQWYWPDRNKRLPAPPISIIVDQTVPELQIDEPFEGTFVRDPTIELIGSVSDAHLPSHNNTMIEVELTHNGAAVGSGPRRIGLNGTAFHYPLRLPAGSEDGEYQFTIIARDAVGNAARREVRVALDQTAPRLKQAASFLPERNGSRLSGVTIRGTANESIASATVNQVTASVTGDQFECHGLPVESGASAYEIVLVDIAGNEARLPRVGHNIDVTPPTVTALFAGGSGNAVATIRGGEALQSVVVNGVQAKREVDGSFSASLSHSLNDLRDAAWGPTHDPIEIVATDNAGNATSVRFVVRPQGTPVGIVLGGKDSSGQYCSHTNEHSNGRRSGVPVDFWIGGGMTQCGECGNTP